MIRMCMAIVGKVAAIDRKIAIVDLNCSMKKAENILSAKPGDFVVLRGKTIIEILEKNEGKKLLQCQTVLLRKLRSKKKSK